LFVTVIPKKLASQEFDAGVEASGPHDFAVRFALFVRANICAAALRVHRIPSPTFVTIAKRPFVRAGMAGDVEVIWVGSERQYFSRQDWTGQISLIAQENFTFTRRAHGRFIGGDNRHMMY
jgi:hypothetical protein